MLRTDLPDGEPAAYQEHNAYFVENSQTGDWAYDDDIESMIALYEMDGLPFTVQRFPAVEKEE